MTGATLLRHRTLSNTFVRAVAQSYLMRVIGAAGSLLVTILVARILGPEGRGAYALAFAVTSLGIQLGALGLHSANVYMVARDPRRADTLVGNSLVAGGLASLLVAVLVAAGLTLFSPIPLVHGGTVAVTVLWIPAGLLFLLLQHLLLGLGDTRAYNVGDLVSKLVVVAGVVIIAVTGHGSVVLFLTSSVLGAGFGLLVLARALAAHHVRAGRPSLPLLRTSLAYGLRTYIAAFFSLALLRADMLLVQHYLGERQTGYYSVAVSITDMLFMLPVVVGALGFARMSAAPSQDERRRQARLISVAMGTVMLTVAGVIAAVATPLVHVLFGSAYTSSVVPLLWLLPGVVFLSVNIVLNNHFAASGMPWPMVWIPGLLVALNLGINTWVIPRYGISGASVTSTLCYGLMLGVSCSYLAITRKRAST